MQQRLDSKQRLELISFSNKQLKSKIRFIQANKFHPHEQNRPSLLYTYNR